MPPGRREHEHVAPRRGGKQDRAVRVHVAPDGKVSRAEIANQGPSKYFADLALQAARRWQFQPSPGGEGDRQWLLRFDFTSGATRVHPEREAQR